jgi:hypothetical protein
MAMCRNHHDLLEMAVIESHSLRQFSKHLQSQLIGIGNPFLRVTALFGGGTARSLEQAVGRRAKYSTRTQGL